MQKNVNTYCIAKTYLDEIVKLHDLLKTIVSYYDVKFMNCFWILFKEIKNAI